MILILGCLSWAAWALPPGLDPSTTPADIDREHAVATVARHPEATETLFEVLRDDPAPRVRLCAAEALFARWAAKAEDPDAYQAIAAWAAQHAHGEVREAALRALAATGHQPARMGASVAEDRQARARAAYERRTDTVAARAPREAGARPRR